MKIIKNKENKNKNKRRFHDFISKHHTDTLV